MKCGEYESYYLKEYELKLLLAGMGVKKIYGLFSKEQDEMVTRRDANKIMAELYHKDIIDWEGDSVVVKEPFSSILSVIADCTQYIVIHGRQKECPVRCCYLSQNKIVVTEKSQREYGTLILSYFTKEEWFYWIDGTMNLIEDRVEWNKKTDFSETISNGLEEDAVQYFACEGIQWIYSVRNAYSNSCIARIMIQESIQTYMILQTLQKNQKLLYSREIMRHSLEKCMRGEMT